MNDLETEKGWATAMKKWNSGMDNAVEISQRFMSQALTYIQRGGKKSGDLR